MQTSSILLNRVIAIIKYLILSLAILFALVLAGVNLPFIQRIITSKANNLFLSNNIPLNIERLTLLIDGRIGLTNTAVIRNYSDTIVYAGQIKVNVKIVPLFFKKIRVKNITIRDGVVNLATDTITGKLNLISVFSKGNMVQEKNKKPGKKPEIGINSVNLKNIRFTYNDHKGTQLFQNVNQLNLIIDRFSLADHEIFVGSIDLADADGSLVLHSKSHEEVTVKKSPAEWKFKLSKADLMKIRFTLHQPDQNQKMEFTLGSGDISEAGFSLAGKNLTLERLSLEKPGALIFSSHAKTGNRAISEPPHTSAFPGLWNISGENIKVSGGFFHTFPYNGSMVADSGSSILQINSLTTAIKDLILNSKESGFMMNQLSVALDNGFSLDEGEISFSSDSTNQTKLSSDFRTESSRINLRLEAGNNLSSLISSWRTVPFSLNIDDTQIASGDILSLFPHLSEKTAFLSHKELKMELNCSINGTSGLINIMDFNIKTPAGNALSLSGHIYDVINPDSAHLDLGILAGPVTSSRLKEILLLIGSEADLPDFEPVIIKGNIAGTLSSQEFILDLESLSGTITAEGSLNLQDKAYAMNASYTGIELGKLAGIKDLERLSGNFQFKGREFNPYTMAMEGSFTIDSVKYKGYDYNSIRAELTGENGSFDYSIKSGDPSMKVDLTGSAAIDKKSLSGSISGPFDIDAGKLNVYKEYSASGILAASASRSKDSLSTSLSFKDLVVSNNNLTEALDNLALSFQSGDSLITGNIESDFLRGDFRFSCSIDELINIIKKDRSGGLYLVDSTVSNRIPFVSDLPPMELTIESEYDPFIALFVSDSILSYDRIAAKMGKDISGITRADYIINRFTAGRSSGYKALMHFESQPDSSLIELKFDSIQYGKIVLKGLEADLKADNDTLIYRFKAGKVGDSLIYDIAGAAFKSERQVRLITTQPVWIINGFSWNVSPGEFLILHPLTKDLTADLHWKNGQHTIDIYGNKSQKLWLELSHVWLNTLLFPGINRLGYDGELTGKISYHGDSGNELDINMAIRQIKLINKDLGNIIITGNFVSDSLGNIESSLRSLRNDTSKLDIMIKSEKESGNKSLLTEFSGIPLDMLEPLSRKYVSGLKGEVNGGLDIKTTGKNAVINGKIGIKNTELKVIPLNARFYLPDDEIKIENSQVLFKQFNVLDSLNKKLSLTGILDFKDPANITADLQVSSDRIQVMNTTSRENKSFNGSIFIDLDLKVKGAVFNPVISGNIKLAEGTIVNYKLTENLNISETEKTITFMSLGEESVSGKVENSILSRPNIEASIEINPNSLFNFEISRGYDIGINITGGGFLNYGVLQNGSISLNGTYEINQGSSTLKIPGWPRKDFVITAGSSVKWNGAVDNPELNIATTSRVRGSYYNPVDSKNREVNFIVDMKIYNSLSQLEIIFDVSSNDQYITSVFSTLSKDERMKQAINLLIFGRVELPNMASSSDYVTQQINQFWESQINQLTKSAIKGVDLSFGIDTYTGVKEGGGEQTYTSFTYEVKKEVFHERGSVMVSGRMNDNSKAGAPTNNMLENFIFEYELDTTQTKYFKVYRQQNYEDLLEGEVIKSGVGFIYRKSYNRLHDIWRRKSKKVTENVINGK